MTGGVLVWRDLICSFDCLLVVFVILHCIYIATSGCREYSSNSAVKFFCARFRNLKILNVLPPSKNEANISSSRQKIAIQAPCRLCSFVAQLILFI